MTLYTSHKLPLKRYVYRELEYFKLKICLPQDPKDTEILYVDTENDIEGRKNRKEHSRPS